jgi:hypothetical protein
MSTNIFKFLNDEETIQNMRFNSLEDLQNAFATNDPFEGIRTNEIAIEMPFGNNSFFAEPPKSELWFGYVDFFKALERFGVGSLKKLDIEEDTKLEEVVITGRVRKTKFNYKNFIATNKRYQSHWEFNETAYPGRVIVNKKEDYLDDNKVFFSYDGLKGRPVYGASFSIYKPYSNDSNTGSINKPNIRYLKKNAAIQIQGLGFGGFLILLNGMEGRVNDDYLSKAYKLIAKLVEKFSMSKTHPPDYLPMLASLNEKILQYISTETLQRLWFQFIRKDSLTNFNETILLNILTGLSNKPNFNADVFLKQLLILRIKGETLFQRLYKKMNDFGGQNNFSELIIRLTLIWMDSNFTNTKNSVYRKFDKPVNLAYKQTKILGFRFDDYDFNFNKKGHIEVAIKPGINLPNNPIGSLIINKRLEKEEVYHPFFPITLTELDETENEDLKLETEVPLPAFYLKAFDDKGAWENFEKTTWLAVDIITTATGIGNLLKLRHLLKLKTAYAYLKLAYGVMEVSSGILSIALNFIDDCENKAFCNKLRQYLFWFEICTLSADALTTRIFRKQAREAKEALKAFKTKVKNIKKQKQLDELEVHLNQVAESDLALRIKGYSSNFATTVSKNLDKASKRTKDFESLHRTSDVEFGQIYNPTTKVADVHTSNLANRILWPNRLIRKMRGGVLTHNHPKGTGLSFADLETFVSTRLKEIRAVTPTGEIFSVTWKQKPSINEFIDLNKEIKEMNDQFNLARSISVGDEAVAIKREFEALYKLLEEKINYIHYTN